MRHPTSQQQNKLLGPGKIEPETNNMAKLNRSQFNKEEEFCEKLILKDVSLLTTADKVIKRCEKELENKLKGQ